MEVNVLYSAIETGNIETVGDILSKHPEYAVEDIKKDHYFYESSTWPLLWYVIENGNNKEFIQLLIDYGAGVETQFLDSEHNRFTLLHLLATLKGDDLEIIEIAKILIQNGANVNVYYKPTSLCPLQAAMIYGRVEYAKFLLKNGARIEGFEWDDSHFPMNCVLASPKMKQKEILMLLIKYGLDPHQHDRYGNDCLSLTILNSLMHPNKIDVLEITKILINCGVSVNSIDCLGSSTLISVIKLANPQLLHLFTEKGVDLNMKSKYIYGIRFTGFSLTSYNGDCKHEAVAKFGWTALHVACYNRDETMMNILIRNGADISLRNTYGETSFSLLKPRKYKESDQAFIKSMVREVAKLKFFNDSAVSENNINLLRRFPLIEAFFQNCMYELFHINNYKFYDTYKYSDILNMSLNNNVKKLAILTKNEEFITEFKANLYKFIHFESDFLRILKQAMELRDEIFTVESRLKAVFGDFLPDVVIWKLADHLTIDELPLEPAENAVKNKIFKLLPIIESVNCYITF